MPRYNPGATRKSNTKGAPGGSAIQLSNANKVKSGGKTAALHVQVALTGRRGGCYKIMFR
jgi:hypothetical protein